MKIINNALNSIKLLPIEDYESGTVVSYGSETQKYGYGIILNNYEGDCIIYDIEDETYYSDYENYYVYEVYENAELVLND